MSGRAAFSLETLAAGRDNGKAKAAAAAKAALRPGTDHFEYGFMASPTLRFRSADARAVVALLNSSARSSGPFAIPPSPFQVSFAQDRCGPVSCDRRRILSPRARPAVPRSLRPASNAAAK